MELWIRTQDRERLIKVFDVYITGSYENIVRANYKGHYSGCEYVDLGEYDSTSRALEILDEIQNILKPKLDLNQYTKEEKEKIMFTLSVLQLPTETKPTYVYEMPSE